MDKSVPQVTASPTYKLAVARGFFYGIATVCGAIMTALAGNNWAEADAQTKFLIVVSIISTVSSTFAAYSDKTMARLSDGKAAIANGNTPAPFPIQPSSV